MTTCSRFSGLNRSTAWRLWVQHAHHWPLWLPIGEKHPPFETPKQEKNTLLKKKVWFFFPSKSPSLMWGGPSLMFFGIKCGGVMPRLEIFGGPSPKSMGRSTDPCWQKSEGHEEIKATSFVNIHTRSLTVRPWKMAVGRFLSYWDGLFSGAMLNFEDSSRYYTYYWWLRNSKQPPGMYKTWDIYHINWLAEFLPTVFHHIYVIELS